jgi:serine phosphatase RsbU (regulator of sigma subunit)
MPLADCLRACDDFFTRSILCDEVPFASLFIAESDERESKFRYASAGHEPGLLFSETGHHRHLDPTGPILGLRAMLPEPSFGERVVPVSGVALLVIVTDGVTEARHTEGDELVLFGSTGVVRAVRDAQFNRRKTAKAIFHAALQHARGTLSDDASIVISTVGGAASLSRHALVGVPA